MKTNNNSDGNFNIGNVYINKNIYKREQYQTTDTQNSTIHPKARDGHAYSCPALAFHDVSRAAAL